MKYTLLEMTKEVLRSIGGDEVDSIEDTIESTTVAHLIKTCYFDIVNSSDYKEHKDLFNFTSTSESTPTLLTRPDSVDYLEWFKYNVRSTVMDGESAILENPIADAVDPTEGDVWKDMGYLSTKDFLEYIHTFNQMDQYTGSYPHNTGTFVAQIYYKSNKAPEFWTSFDDENVILDSFDSYLETFLRTDKTLGYGKVQPSWTHSDNYTPDLDGKEFPLLLNEAKASAWAEIKQVANSRAERKIRQFRIQQVRSNEALPAKDRTWRDSLPNYGRK